MLAGLGGAAAGATAGAAAGGVAGGVVAGGFAAGAAGAGAGVAAGASGFAAGAVAGDSAGLPVAFWPRAMPLPPKTAINNQAKRTNSSRKPDDLHMASPLRRAKIGTGWVLSILFAG